MDNIRRARESDLGRIAEMEVFCYRLNFYPIFREDAFYFGEWQVASRIQAHRAHLHQLLVYDDGVVKGFAHVAEGEIRKLFVEPVLQGGGIGAKLLQYAVRQEGARFLWALEQNEKAIAFYRRHGFRMTGDRKTEEGTDAFLIRMEISG